MLERFREVFDVRAVFSVLAVLLLLHLLTRAALVATHWHPDGHLVPELVSFLGLAVAMVFVLRFATHPRWKSAVVVNAGVAAFVWPLVPLTMGYFRTGLFFPLPLWLHLVGWAIWILSAIALALLFVGLERRSALRR